MVRLTDNLPGILFFKCFNNAAVPFWKKNSFKLPVLNLTTIKKTVFVFVHKKENSMTCTEPPEVK